MPSTDIPHHHLQHLPYHGLSSQTRKTISPRTSTPITTAALQTTKAPACCLKHPGYHLHSRMHADLQQQITTPQSPSSIGAPRPARVPVLHPTEVAFPEAHPPSVSQKMIASGQMLMSMTNISQSANRKLYPQKQNAPVTVPASLVTSHSFR